MPHGNVQKRRSIPFPTKFATLDQLLALIRSAQDDPRKEARSAFEKAIERIDGVIKSQPDAEEHTAKDKALWCAQWHEALNSLLAATLRAQDAGADVKFPPALHVEVRACMETVNGWTKETPKVETVTTTTAAATQDVNPMMSSDARTEDKETLDAPTEAVVSIPLRRKRTLSQVTKSENDKEGKLTGPIPQQKFTKSGKPVIIHSVPCSLCSRQDTVCKGALGRVCANCELARHKCEKSNGRGGSRTTKKARVEDDDEQVPKEAKPETQQHSREQSPPDFIELSEDEEDDGEPVRTKTTGKLRSPPRTAVQVLSLAAQLGPSSVEVHERRDEIAIAEARLLSAQAGLKRAESLRKVAEVEWQRAMRELETAMTKLREIQALLDE